MSVYLDLTEFLVNPITTGIQRIVGEICKYSPAGAFIPVRLSGTQYIELSLALIGEIGKLFNRANEGIADKIRRLGSPENGRPISRSNEDVVLVPEVFDNPQRVSFFAQMPQEELRRYRFIVYDLLPITHPEYFIAANLLDVYGYFRALGRAPNCGFISEDTRDVYCGRLKRMKTRSGPVLPLGCDSLGIRNTPRINRPAHFTVIGTIEPRKNHRMILDAFKPLLSAIDGLSLTFIGKFGWVNGTLGQEILNLAADKNSRFQYYSSANDETIREQVLKSRATIYVSTAEGYGLPPVESLWLGTPVIASSSIPSLKRLPPLGIHYVEPLNIDRLREAVFMFLDETYANRRIEETQQLELPTWRSFAEEVMRWCSAS